MFNTLSAKLSELKDEIANSRAFLLISFALSGFVRKNVRWSLNSFSLLNDHPVSPSINTLSKQSSFLQRRGSPLVSASI